MKMTKTVIAVLATLLMAAACTTSAQVSIGSQNSSDFSNFPEPKIKYLKAENPKNILFVGNSYLYYGDSVHNHVRRMVDAAGLYQESELTYKSATVGGAAIFDHKIDHLLDPKSLRVDKPFEVVILQGGSAAPLSDKRRKRFSETVAMFSEKIEKSGGETVLYMTHAYVEPHARFRPRMIKDIAWLYIETGNDIGALVIPVGLAFEESYRRRPDMPLHKPFDGSHPNLHGTYLASATVFASLYGVSPVGIPYDYFGEVDPETALYLQTVAQDTVTQFYRRDRDRIRNAE